MAATFSITIENLAKFQAAFERAPQAAATRSRAAMNSAVQVTKNEIVPRTPTRTGKLRSGYTVSVSGSAPATLVGSIANATPYGPPIEFGARPHVIVPRTASILRFVAKDGTTVFTKLVNHPGNRAYRMMRDGTLAATPKVIALFAAAWQELTAQLGREATR